MSSGTLDPTSRYGDTIALWGDRGGRYDFDVSFESDLNHRNDLFDLGGRHHSAHRVIIDPVTDFAPGETLTLLISTDAKDLAGNPLQQRYETNLHVEDPDTTGPEVWLTGISETENDPSRFTTSTISVSGGASDPHSGVASNRFKFRTNHHTGSNWEGWVDHGYGGSSRSLGSLADGLYKIDLIAENTDGITGNSDVGYFRVDTYQPNQRPSIGSLSAHPDPVAQGATLELFADNVQDADGSVVKVAFYHDSNRNGQYDTNDRHLGEDASVTGGTASISFSTGTMDTTTQRFFGRAIDNSGDWSSMPAVTTVQIAGTANVPPSVSSLTASPDPLPPNSDLTLTAYGLYDSDGSISSVYFYRDSNGDGRWDSDDGQLGVGSSVSGQQSSLILGPGTLAPGTHVLFTRPEDNHGLLGNTASTSVRVEGGQEPYVGWATVDPGTVQPGETLTIEWNAHDNVGVDHVGLYLYQGQGTTDAYKVDTTPYVAGGHPDGRLGADEIDLPNVMLHRWTVPNLPFANDYRIKVVAWDGNHAGALAGYRFTPFFSVGAQEVPRIVSLGADPSVVISGNDFKLIATVALPEYADYVEFYRDVDGNGRVSGSDEFLGSDNVSGAGYAETWVDTVGLAATRHTFIATMRLVDGTWAEHRTRKVTITARPNQAPGIGTLIAPSTVEFEQPWTLRATGINDEGQIEQVEFHWDYDGDGDLGVLDSKLGEDETVLAGEALITVPNRRVAVGSQQIIARALDDRGAWSDWISTSVTVRQFRETDILKFP